MSQIPGVSVDVQSAAVTVTLVGDLDIGSAQKVMDAVLPVLDQYESRDMTLDLTGVEFCDSSGMTALIKLRKRTAESGWRLHTVNLQPAVRRIVVDFGGLGDYLNVLDR